MKTTHFLFYVTVVVAIAFSNVVNVPIAHAASWSTQTEAGSRTWRSISVSDDGSVIGAVVDGGYLYTSSDAGASWQERTDAGFRNWRSIALSEDGSVMAAVAYSLSNVHTSTNFGATWLARTNSGSRNWHGTAVSANGVKMASAAYSGYVYTTEDTGSTWSTKSNASGSRNWYSITSSDDGSKLAAVVTGGYLYTSIDAGTTWTERTSLGSKAWYVVSSSGDGSKIAAVADTNYLYTSEDSGETWTEHTSLGTKAWRSVSVSDDGSSIAAVVSNGYVYTSADFGDSWETHTDLGVKQWLSVSITADGGQVFAGVSNGYIYKGVFDTTAPTIQTFTPADNTVDIAVTSNLTIEFSEAVDVESGDITIYNAVNDSVIEVIDVTSGLVTGTGTNTITINPTTDFEEGTTYYVHIDSTAFDDAAGNSFAGIADETVWNFTTFFNPGTFGGGTNRHLTTVCTPSDRTVQTGDEVTFEVDISTSEDEYDFEWTKVVNGDNEDIEYTFNTAGTYYPRGRVSAGRAGEAVVNCGTITVLGDTDTSEHKRDEDTDDRIDDDENENESVLVTSSFSQDQVLGTTSEDTQRLQRLLNTIGFTIAADGPGAPGQETAYFGVRTQTAVQRFQQALNITPADGSFTGITRGILNLVAILRGL